MKLIYQIILIISLIVVTIPRFNWGGMGPLKSFVGGKPFDIEQYETYTKYFSGEKEKGSEMEGPFAYRPFVPFLASFLPFEALTSINLINLLFLIITLYPLVGLLKHFKLEGNYLLLGEVLFVFSFPVFYYGTSGYIDSVLIAFIMMGTYLLLNKKLFLFFLTFVIGMSVKETIIILIPVFAVYLFFLKNVSLRKKIMLFLSLIIIYGMGMFFLRRFTPGAESYIWYPSFDIFFSNLARSKTYLSIFLTFGLPGIGALSCIYKFLRNKVGFTQEAVLITGLLISMLISFFSLFAAYADGRHIWTSYPFTIPLAIIYLKSLKKPGSLLLKFQNS